MYVVDITRDNFENDILVGNGSMFAKIKTINYIIDYVFANHNIYLDKDILDRNLNMNKFSLKKFLKDNYQISIKNDLKIQGVFVDKNHCLFLKYMDNKNDFPLLYVFKKEDINNLNTYIKYLINETLINKYQDDILEYDRLKVDYDTNVNSLSSTYLKFGIYSEVISLYNGGLFLQELLDNNCTLKELKKYGGINI